MTVVDFYTNPYTHCKIQIFLRQAEQEDQEHHQDHYKPNNENRHEEVEPHFKFVGKFSQF